tara:strand:+ start:55 stop:378 length:324 start_codon:yes stop_codon:yes gene_type:complete
MKYEIDEIRKERNEWRENCYNADNTIINLKKEIEELKKQLFIHGVVSSKTLSSKIANKRERLKGDLDNATNIINGNKGMSSDYIIDKARNMPFLRCKLNLIDELLAD